MPRSNNPTISQRPADPASASQKIDNRRQTYVRFSPELHKRLRRLAAERDVRMVDLIIEAIEQYLAQEEA